MNKVFSGFRKNFTKIFLSFVVALPVMLFLNTGFLIDPYWKIIQSFIFALIFTIVFIWPQLRKTFFWISLLLTLIMAFFYIIGSIEWAEMAGSTGFGFILINLVSYLPQITKLGYIRKL